MRLMIQTHAMICHQMLPEKLRKIYLTKNTFSQHTMNIPITCSMTREGIAVNYYKLTSMGYTQVHNFQDRMRDWRRNGKQILYGSG